MTTFSLKRYQQSTLDALETFFRRARVAGHVKAWDESPAARDTQNRPIPYDSATMGAVPAVCVRIPTGGGKTTMAAHAIARVGQAYADTDAPVALWLVPSDAIRTQTLAALREVEVNRGRGQVVDLSLLEPMLSIKAMLAPPCSRPAGWWVRASTGMRATRKSSPTSVNSIPICETAVLSWLRLICSRLGVWCQRDMEWVQKEWGCRNRPRL